MKNIKMLFLYCNLLRFKFEIDLVQLAFKVYV